MHPPPVFVVAHNFLSRLNVELFPNKSAIGQDCVGTVFENACLPGHSESMSFSRSEFLSRFHFGDDSHLKEAELDNFFDVWFRSLDLNV